MSRRERINTILSRYSALMCLYTLSSATQSFPMVSVGAVLNQELGCSAGEVTLYYALIFIPWNLRSIYGLISDTVSIYGYRRKPYIVGCNLCVSVGYLLYGNLVSSLARATLVGIFVNVFYAFSESVIDAISIDKIRLFDPDGSDRVRLSSDIQSASMFFRTLGSTLSLLCAGVLSRSLSPRTLISISSAFPILMVCLCIFVRIEVQVTPVKPQFFKYIEQCIATRKWPIEIFKTIRPVVLPAIFILIYASCPTSNVVYSNYLYTSTGFTQFQFHMLAQFTSIGALIGTGIFWVVFRNITKIHVVFVYSILVAALATISRLLVILANWNSFTFIAFDEALVNIAARITLMPIQVYGSIAASHPEHFMYEGFIFGFFASIENWGGAISGLLSSSLADKVDLSTLVIVTASVSFVPLFCLSFIKPRDVLGIEPDFEQKNHSPINASV